MSDLRERTRRVIFEHDTAAGRGFDIALIAAIITSVVIVMIDSVPGVSQETRNDLLKAEWVFTALFTVEYVLRIWSSDARRKYVLSFFGAVDLFAILPTYIELLVPGSRFLAVIRVLRVLRVFRILKLMHFVGEASTLGRALRASRYKITVFVFTVFAIVVIVGSLMYIIEGAESGFTSIPESIYWAIVTLTTVGYGDIAPITPLGRLLAVMLMITGYGIIAVPTGIVTVELERATRTDSKWRTCVNCGRATHAEDAQFCAGCGTPLGESRPSP